MTVLPPRATCPACGTILPRTLVFRFDSSATPRRCPGCQADLLVEESAGRTLFTLVILPVLTLISFLVALTIGHVIADKIDPDRLILVLVRFGIGFFAIAPPLLSMYAVAPYVMRFRLDASKGLCRRCGYDLRASKNSCPECGEAIPRGLPNTTTHQDLQGKS